LKIGNNNELTGPNIIKLFTALIYEC
jgi:hypothetical protein